jgi:membrane protease YdiL (CAAX protease family)
VKDSPSTTSPSWPTRWPKDSFRGFWSWSLFAVLVLVLAGVFALTFVNAPKAASVAITAQNRLIFNLAIVFQAVVEGALIWLVLGTLPSTSKFSLRELGFRRPDGRTILIALGGAVAMIVVANGLASLIDSVLHSKHEQDVVELVKNMRDPASLVIVSVYAIVLAPFFEESLFRVYFFNFGMRWGGVAAGAILSGALFGMAHGDPYAAFPLAVGGAILCLVYYYTRNAWASMISHGIFNSVSILGLLFFPKIFSN